MAPISCNHRDEVLAYCRAELTEDAAKETSRHVSSCHVCQATCADFDRRDPLSSHWREPIQPDPFQSEPEAVQLITLGKALLPPADAELPGFKSQQAVPPDQVAPSGEVEVPPLQRLGEYEILEKLGQGGMGVVYRALHRSLRRAVAIKVLTRSRAHSPDALSRFRREMAVIGQLQHPNIVTAYDAGQQNGTPYLVMEYVDGSDLGKLVRQHGRLPVFQAVDYVLQAARGLAYAHQKGIIHRDIKPANLLLDRQGNVKVLDLGLARLTFPLENANEPDPEWTTGSGQILGTWDYVAPEQAEDVRAADHRADIYSLGCTLHRLLIGRPPYQAETLMELLAAHRQGTIPSLQALRADVPPQLDAIFQKMVAKQPADRYLSMTDLIDDLERFRAETAASGDVAPQQSLDAPALVEKSTATLAAVKQETLPSPVRHRPPRRWAILAGTLFLSVIAMAVIIRYRNTRVEVPPGSEVMIADGTMTVELPPQATSAKASPAAIDPSRPVPAVAGLWRESTQTLVNVVQTGNRITAHGLHTDPKGQVVRWRCEGTIAPDRTFRTQLAHLTNLAGAGAIQTRVGTISTDGLLVRGSAHWASGQHDFTWTLVQAGSPQWKRTKGGFPAIDGSWEELPGIQVAITQEDGAFRGLSDYVHRRAGRIRSRFEGVISPEGLITIEVRHLEAPAEWKTFQRRTAALTPDGKMLIGHTWFEGGGHAFQWKRQVSSSPKPTKPSPR